MNVTWNQNRTYEALNGFPAGLMTCGEDVSSMQVVTVPTDNSKPTSILVLGATNGAYCMRRVGRRKDGRVHCVLLSCCSGAEIEVGAPKFGFPPMMESCPITVLSYNSGTDTFLFGDAMGVASEVTGLSRELTDRQLLPASLTKLITSNLKFCQNQCSQSDFRASLINN